MRSLSDQRRKLLGLYYEDRISSDLFEEEERRLAGAIEAVRNQVAEQNLAESTRNALADRFEAVAAMLRDLNIEVVWEAADDQERRILVEELVEWVTVFRDHLEVTVAGAPRLNVLFSEVGLKESEKVGVGGGT